MCTYILLSPVKIFFQSLPTVSLKPNYTNDKLNSHCSPLFLTIVLEVENNYILIKLHPFISESSTPKSTKQFPNKIVIKLVHLVHLVFG